MNTNEQVARMSAAGLQEQMQSPAILQAERATRYPAPSPISIYDVVDNSNPNFPGRFYKCIKQKLRDFPNAYTDMWEYEDQTEPYATVDILNLYESNPRYYEDPTLNAPGLFYNDRIMAWPITNPPGGTILVGIPIVPPVRMMSVRQSDWGPGYIRGSGINISGGIIASGQLGYHLKVYGLFCQSADFQNSSPYLEAGNIIFARHVAGRWFMVTQLQGYCAAAYGCQPEE